MLEVLLFLYPVAIVIAAIVLIFTGMVWALTFTEGYDAGEGSHYYYNNEKGKFLAFAYDKGYRSGRNKLKKKPPINWGIEYEKDAHAEGILTERYRSY